MRCLLGYASGLIGIFALLFVALFANLGGSPAAEMRIAFFSDGKIYRMNTDGSDLKVLSEEIYVFDMFWTLDAQWLMVIESGYLLRIPAEGGDFEVMDVSYEFAEMMGGDIDPNGQWLIVSGSLEPYDTHALREIFRFRPDGTHIEQLTDTTQDSSSASYSPDGRWIVFEDGSPHATAYLYLMRADGTETRQISTVPINARSPSWSPDGEWIVFDASPENYFERDIFRMRPDGTQLQQITHTKGDNHSPSWSPDGRWITYVSNQRQGYSIYRIRPNGSHDELLFTPARYSEHPEWSPLIDLEWSRWPITGLGFGLLGFSIAMLFWRAKRT